MKYLGSTSDNKDVVNLETLPFKKDGNSGAVLAGGSNAAIGGHSTASGVRNVAGIKGWYYKRVDFANRKLYLTATQPTQPAIGTGTVEALDTGYSVYDRLYIINKKCYTPNDGIDEETACMVIESINNNCIQVNEIPFNTIEIINEKDSTDFSVFCLKKPNLPNGVDIGLGAFVEGIDNIAIYGGHAEGEGNIALTALSHAEGYHNEALGYNSHVEGYETKTGAADSHAEGSGSIANGAISHAEGYHTVANGSSSHAENNITKANGVASHAEGYNSETGGNYTSNTKDAGTNSNPGAYAHAEGNATIAKGINSHAEGLKTFASGFVSHAEGAVGTANGSYSHSEGYWSDSNGSASHAEGNMTRADGLGSHAEGNETVANGMASHAGGSMTVASGDRSYAMGYQCEAIGNNSHAEGYGTIVNASGGHAEGYISETGGSYTSNSKSPATISTNGAYAHAEGNATIAIGVGSHAEGEKTFAKGKASHAEGAGTQTSSAYEHAEGYYNKSNKDSSSFGSAGNTLHSIGMGSTSTRKNAFEIMQDGKAYLYNLGGYNGTNPTSSTDLKTIINNKQDKITSTTSLTCGSITSSSDCSINAVLQVDQILFSTKKKNGSNPYGHCRMGRFDEYGGLKIQLGNLSGDEATSVQIINHSWTQSLFCVDENGDLTIPGEFISGSDARWKHNIVPVSNGVNTIMRLMPSEWEWNKDNHKGSGLIAQQVQSVLPHLVKTDNFGYLHLSYEGLHAYEISAIQSHEMRIQQLEHENAELKKQLQQLNL